MRFKTTFAQTATGGPVDNARAAAAAIKRDFDGFDPSLVLFFAATDYDPAVIAAEMQSAFPGATTMGCTTAGEACDERMLNASVVAMGFSKEVFAFSETALVLLDGDRARAADSPEIFADTAAAVEYLARNTGKKPIDLDYREYLGFMLSDTIVMEFAENVAERAGEMTNVFFTGGISGDDYRLDGTSQAVFYKGKAYRNGAAAIALWKPAKGFELVKTQAVELTDKQYTVTKADEVKRIIWELDGRDAIAVYAAAVGLSPEKMGNPEFDDNPLALVAEGEPFLRAIAMQIEGKGIHTFDRIREGMRLTVTKSKDIVEKTREALEAKMAATGRPEAILHVNCSSRHTAMGRTGRLEAFGEIFHGIPHAGFSSYGEIYVSRVAITSLMILFK